MGCSPACRGPPRTRCSPSRGSGRRRGRGGRSCTRSGRCSTACGCSVRSSACSCPPTHTRNCSARSSRRSGRPCAPAGHAHTHTRTHAHRSADIPRPESAPCLGAVCGKLSKRRGDGGKQMRWRIFGRKQRRVPARARVVYRFAIRLISLPGGLALTRQVARPQAARAGLTPRTHHDHQRKGAQLEGTAHGAGVNVVLVCCRVFPIKLNQHTPSPFAARAVWCGACAGLRWE